MAFNSPSPKYPIVYKSTIEEIGRVGPGSYNINQNKQNLSSPGSQHVFNSKIERSNQKQLNKNSLQLGPGKYDIEPAYQKFVVHSKISPCKASFNSKIQRFPSPVPDKKPSQQGDEETNIYGFLLEEQSAKRKLGKLFSIVRDRKKISQSIPSIPTAEQSFGYRVDQSTKQLVQNENPNILLARKTITKEIDSKIFATTNSLYKGPSSCFGKENNKGLKWHKQNENSNKNNQKETEESLNPIEASILKQGSPRQKSWEKKGNTLVSKQSRFNYDKMDKRKQLLINSLKKKYIEFISDEKETEKILRLRMQQSNVRKNELPEEKILRNIQCFLSKKNRFPQQKQHISLLPIENKKQHSLCTSPQKVKNNSQFGSKSPRFDHRNKQSNPKIGPGSYQNLPKQSKIKHCCLKQEEARFLQIRNSHIR